MVEGANVLEAALDGEADIEALFAAPEAEAAVPGAARPGRPAGDHGPPPRRRGAGAGGGDGDPPAGPGRRPATRPRPGRPRAHERPEGMEPKLLVVGVDVRDPGNGGTLIRSAEAAGAHGVIFCRGSVDVTNPKTVRASAGALFHVPVVEGCDPQEVLGVLGDLGLMRIAAVAHDGERPDRVDLSRPLALMLR